MYQRRTADGIL